MKGPRPIGQFCWINILTAQPTAAREFFSQMLGWSYRELPGMGHLILVGGEDVGGLFDLEGPQTPPGCKPIVGVMVLVKSADEIAEKAKALGGKSQAAFNVMDKGRMSVCHDPGGAEFDVWQAGTSAGTDVDSTLHGAPSWTELMTRDVAEAKRFYGGLFGWTTEAVPGSQWGYELFKQHDAKVGGTMAIPPAMGDMRPHWITYFTVKDIERATRQATELKGRVVIPITRIPDVGRFAGIISPQGVGFCVMQYDANYK